MAVTIKTPEEIEKMRVAGRLAAEVLEMIGEYVKPGVTTGELDRICHDYIVNTQQAIPAPLNYGNPPFPKSICTSVNHVICHGIPSDDKALSLFKKLELSIILFGFWISLWHYVLQFPKTAIFQNKLNDKDLTKILYSI